MDQKDSLFEEDFAEDENEDVNDSENNNDDADEGEAPTKVKKIKKVKKTKTPPAVDAAEDDDDSSNNYRPKEEDKETDEDKVRETVPLKKYLKLKQDLKKALRSDDTSSINKETLEEFAEDAGLKPAVVKKLAKIIISQASEEATRAAQDKVKPLVKENISHRNEVAFEKDFAAKISSRYPSLESKMGSFKKIAFSKDFLHLKNLEAIRKEFFPDAKLSTKATKTATVEGGSKGGKKETKKIDFKTLTQNSELYEKVMKNPAARKKYYAWQDSNA